MRRRFVLYHSNIFQRQLQLTFTKWISAVAKKISWWQAKELYNKLILNIGILFLIVYGVSSTFLATNSQEHFIPNRLQPPVSKSWHQDSTQTFLSFFFFIKTVCEYKNMAGFACCHANFGVVPAWEGTNIQRQSQGLSEYLRLAKCAVICLHSLVSSKKEKCYICTVKIVQV